VPSNTQGYQESEGGLNESCLGRGETQFTKNQKPPLRVEQRETKGRKQEGKTVSQGV